MKTESEPKTELRLFPIFILGLLLISGLIIPFQDYEEKMKLSGGKGMANMQASLAFFMYFIAPGATGSIIYLISAINRKREGSVRSNKIEILVASLFLLTFLSLFYVLETKDIEPFLRLNGQSTIN